MTHTCLPKKTAGIGKFKKIYTIELDKFNISNRASSPDETSKGINAALQYAKANGLKRIIFPKGTYMISEKEPVVIDHKDTVIDFNGATIAIRPNGLTHYSIVQMVHGAENLRRTGSRIASVRTPRIQGNRNDAARNQAPYGSFRMGQI